MESTLVGAEMSKSGGELPEEMIREVLIRLPVKSLLVCKSVCKPWLHTISSPDFIKYHLHHVLTASQNYPTLLEFLKPRPVVDFDIDDDLLVEIEQQEQLRLEHLYRALLDVNRQDLSSVPIRIRRVVSRNMVIGSCYNGILCVTSRSFGDIYLWNPSIRQCKKVPPPNPCPDRVLLVGLQFGFDSVSDDYKVIRFLYNISFDDYVRPILQVYSSNANSWTEFHPPCVETEAGLLYFATCIVINGVLYYTTSQKIIVSFDLRKQVFVLVPFPASIRTRKSRILDFKGSVALFFESGSRIDLWTLDDVSGKVSWTKRFGIEDDSNLDMWLTFYLGAGQFYGMKLINKIYLYNFLYDYEKKETRYYRLGERDVYITLNYIETLVSLNGFEQVESFNGIVEVE